MYKISIQELGDSHDHARAVQQSHGRPAARVAAMPPPDAHDHRLRAGGAGPGTSAPDVWQPYWRNHVEIKVSVYETLRIGHHASFGKAPGICPASCRRVAGCLAGD